MSTVEEDDEGRYVEEDGLRYRSEDLPSIGTDVDVDAFRGTDEGYYADVYWNGEAGRTHTRGRAWP